MTTIEKKLEKARKRREALVLAEAEQTARLADRERDAREAELTELLEATKPKLVRLAACACLWSLVIAFPSQVSQPQLCT